MGIFSFSYLTPIWGVFWGWSWPPFWGYFDPFCGAFVDPLWGAFWGGIGYLFWGSFWGEKCVPRSGEKLTPDFSLFWGEIDPWN
jgi:hypothetical protein